MRWRIDELATMFPQMFAMPRSVRPISVVAFNVVSVGHGKYTYHHRNGVEKMKSCLYYSLNEFGSSSDLPTTRPALLFPNADAADSPFGTAEEAILVIEIDDVFVAKMVSGLVSAANSENIRCLSSRFSETALGYTLCQRSAARTNPHCLRTSITISVSRNAFTPTAWSTTDTRSRACRASAS